MGASGYFKERPMLSMFITIASSWALAFATIAYGSSKQKDTDLTKELDTKASIEYVDQENKEVKDYVDIRVNSIEINTQQEFNNIKNSQKQTQEYLEKHMEYLREDLQFIRERLD